VSNLPSQPLVTCKHLPLSTRAPKTVSSKGSLAMCDAVCGCDSCSPFFCPQTEAAWDRTPHPPTSTTCAWPNSKSETKAEPTCGYRGGWVDKRKKPVNLRKPPSQKGSGCPEDHVSAKNHVTTGAGANRTNRCQGPCNPHIAAACPCPSTARCRSDTTAFPQYSFRCVSLLMRKSIDDGDYTGQMGPIIANVQTSQGYLQRSESPYHMISQ